MTKFIKKYIDQVLILTALIFIGLLIWFFIASTAAITADFSSAIGGPANAEGNMNYNLGGASKLDYRGLGQ